MKYVQREQADARDGKTGFAAMAASSSQGSGPDLVHLARIAPSFSQLSTAGHEDLAELLEQNKAVLQTFMELEKQVALADSKRIVMSGISENTDERVATNNKAAIDLALAELTGIAREVAQSERVIAMAKECARELALDHGVSLPGASSNAAQDEEASS